MTRKNKIIIIVAAILILLAISILIWWLLVRNAGQTIDQPVVEPKKLPAVTNQNNVNAVIVQDAEVEANLKSVALIFAERFGSYSNQGSFANLDDLRDLMTIRMKGWIDTFIAEQKVSAGDSSSYSGITTKALGVNITEFDESIGRAEVIVSTQRQEAQGTTVNPRVYYQDMLLRLVKTGSGWKVDEAVWQ